MLVFDIETNGLLPKVDTIHCIVALDTETKHMQTFRPHEIEAGLEVLKGADTLIGHNICGYDLPVIQHITGVDLRHIPCLDTLAISRALFIATLRDADTKRLKQGFPKRLLGAHSLESWGYRLGCKKGEFGKDTDWSTFSEEMLSYCKRDVILNHRLWEFLFKFERVPGTPAMPLLTMKVESRIHGIMGEQERAGIEFDVQGAEEIYSKLIDEKVKLVDQLREAFPPIWVNRGQFVPKRDNRKMGYKEGCPLTKIELVEFNPGSDIQVANRLKKMGWEPEEFTPNGQPKVDETSLVGLDLPHVPKLLQYKLIEKRIGQIAEGNVSWLKLEKQGRLHGKVWATGTRTSRMSASRPNLQQVPRVGSYLGAECRGLFGPKEGYLMGVDARALELRILSNRLAPFDDGAFSREVVEGDVHEMMRKATGLYSRDNQKTFTYATIFGAGMVRLGKIVAKDLRQSNHPVTSSEAYLGKQAHSRLLTRLKGMGPLLEQCKRAHKQGFIQLVDGRFVQSLTERSALNTAIQGDGAAIMKRAQFLLDIYLNDIDGWQWGLTVHDEWQIVADTEDIAHRIGKLAVQAIQDTKHHLNLFTPLDAEYKVGRTWKDTH